MRHKLIAALAVMAASSPAAAAQPESAWEAVPVTVAPEAPPHARYCLRVEPETGSRIEMIRCETRQEWALLGVDVDKEWAEEGVRVLS